jgi:hypothetical protein
MENTGKERKTFMSAVSAEPSTDKSYRGILWGGLVAGTLDITAACISSGLQGGRGPIGVLQSVASGLLGANSYQGGLPSAALGLVVHFLIAFVATTVFYAASRKLKFLLQQPFLFGVLYGIAVYLVMYMIVLPITFSRKFNSPLKAVIIGLTIHILCVGLPISLIVRKYSLASLTLALLAFAILAPLSVQNTAAATLPQATTATPPAVLVELFTSEGCSTCPPADKLLADLDQNQPIKGVQIIALSEHVDYWNRLGWKDPFSSAEFSKRQLGYREAFGLKDVYTPQVIVDGRTEFVGGKLATAREAIIQAAGSPKATLRLAIKLSASRSVTLTMQVENLPEVAAGDTADVMLAITESNLLSNVTKGENAGRKLIHSAVTRKLLRIGSVTNKTFNAEKTFELDSAWNRANLKAVTFVQERLSRRVLGAAAIKLANDL